MKKSLLLIPFLLLACDNEKVENVSLLTEEESVNVVEFVQEKLPVSEDVVKELGVVLNTMGMKSDLALMSVDVLQKKSIEKFSLCNTYTNEECIREDTLLYFLNFANGGYAILNAKDESDPIIAVVGQGSISSDEFLVEDSLNLIHQLILAYVLDENRVEEDDEQVLTSAPQIKALPSGDWTITEQYGPLICTKWHQGAPFNELFNGKAVGCISLAMAQIVAYKQYPSIIDFPLGNTCTWAQINSKQRPTTSVEWNFLQHYLRSISDRCNTEYGYYESSAGLDDLKTAMGSLGYNTVRSQLYALSAVKNMTSLNKPVFALGMNVSSGKGHCWIIDGYRKYKKGVSVRNYVNCVIGWENYTAYDGWYRSGIFDPHHRDAISDSEAPTRYESLKLVTYANPN